MPLSPMTRPDWSEFQRIGTERLTLGGVGHAIPESFPRPSPNFQARAPVSSGDGTDQDYLATLNAEQRRAVEYGIGAARGDGEGPLLVIAGAGSGKTNTLAYRVAHLVFNGVD